MVCNRITLRCTNCSGSNEIDYRFCKFCGTKRDGCKLIGESSENRNCASDDRINQRIKDLDELLNTSKYSKQKNNLTIELTSFLENLSPPKDLLTAVPTDVRKFLIFKEKDGKTQLHERDCSFKGLSGRKSCECPKTLAAKTTDSLIGKVRAIFRDIGRSGEWNPILLTGNPAASYLMKRHLQSVTLEQTFAEIPKKQAVPLMFEKLAKLCRYLAYKASVEKDTVKKYLYLRDRAFFSVLCHSGDRGYDLGNLSISRLFELPDAQGIFVSEVIGKVASLDNPKNFVLLKSKDEDICPVRLLENYINFASQSGIDLRSGYIFRVKDKKSGQIADKAVSSSSMTDRLRLHLRAVNLYEGESSHSSRRGCAITLKMLDVKDDIIRDHVGWGTNKMLEHYARIGGLCGPRGAAKRLSEASEGGQGISDLCKVSRQFMSLRNLSRFHFKD